MATHGEKRWPPAGRFNGHPRGGFHGHRHSSLTSPKRGSSLPLVARRSSQLKVRPDFHFDQIPCKEAASIDRSQTAAPGREHQRGVADRHGCFQERPPTQPQATACSRPPERIAASTCSGPAAAAASPRGAASGLVAGRSEFARLAVRRSRAEGRRARRRCCCSSISQLSAGPGDAPSSVRMQSSASPNVPRRGLSHRLRERSYCRDSGPELRACSRATQFASNAAMLGEGGARGATGPSGGCAHGVPLSPIAR